MLIQLIGLVLLLVGAVAIAAVSLQSGRARARVIGRLGSRPTTENIPILTSEDDGLVQRFGSWAKDRLPDGVLDSKSNTLLLQAGFDSQAAPSAYAMLRIICALVFPAVAFVLAPRDSVFSMVMWGGIGVGLGLMGPPGVLERLRGMRQDRIRRSIPDSLDLLLVCVEAGVSLDSAILRVGREMAMLHPELSAEFMNMNRRMNAGIRREEALHALFARTGVEELRSLGTNMIQSERWGTSIAKVLRVYSETLRRKRRQAAEKKAAVAATKMVIPLALFILPALFAVIGGPIVLTAGAVFGFTSP